MIGSRQCHWQLLCLLEIEGRKLQRTENKEIRRYEESNLQSLDLVIEILQNSTPRNQFNLNIYLTKLVMQWQMN